jgi:hypothetical protein
MKASKKTGAFYADLVKKKVFANPPEIWFK